MKLLTNLYEKIMNEKKYRILFICLLGLLSTAIILFIKLRHGHDIYFHLSRIKGIKESFNTELFPNIYSNYLDGYGYANPLFYPDIFLYFPAFLNYLGLSLTMSYKTFLLVISILSSLTMYISVKGISKSKYAGIISSIIYTFAAYRLTDMFIRAALGETLAFIFAPLIIYGIYNIIYEDYKKFYILIIGMSGLILSHVLTSIIMCIVLFIICLFNIKRLMKEKRIIYLIISALITLLLTSYFIFPMLEQLKNTTYVVNSVKQIGALGSLAERAVPIYAIILAVPYTFYQWMPPGMGIIFIYIVYLKFKTRKIIKDNFMNLLFIVGLIFWLISSNIFPWKIFNNTFSIIQFPWRLYFVATLLLTISGSMMFAKKFESKEKRVKNIITIFIILIPSFLISLFTIIFGNKADFKEANGYIAMGEYLQVNVDRNYIAERGDIIESNNNIEINYTKNNSNYTIKFKNDYEDTNIELPLIYYKGYEAKIENQKLDINVSDNGLVLVNIGNIKEGVINVKYAKTPIIKITRIISLLTLIIFTVYLIFKRKEKKK